MKISSFLLGTTLAQNVDLWPMNYESVGRAFQTYADSRTERKLDNVEGEIPAWIYGTLYRNGPAIYEWGEEKYNHFFDPTAILQGFRSGIQINRIFNIDINIAIFEKAILILPGQYIARGWRYIARSIYWQYIASNI